jgi:peroxiredoxin
MIKFDYALILALVLVQLLPAPREAQGRGLEEVQDAPPLELNGQTLNGLTWRLKDQRGHPVLVHFWAAWCDTCLEEMPAFNRASQRLRSQGVVAVCVDVGDAERRVRTLIAQFGMDTPVLLDPNGDSFKNWKATVLPSTYVIDSDGRMRLTVRGPLQWDDPETEHRILGVMSD